jgi:hypothetical protein
MKHKEEDSFTKAWNSIFLDPWIPILWTLFIIGVILGLGIALLLTLIF